MKPPSDESNRLSTTTDPYVALRWTVGWEVVAAEVRFIVEIVCLAGETVKLGIGVESVRDSAPCYRLCLLKPQIRKPRLYCSGTPVPRVQPLLPARKEIMPV